ncbi:MAG: hypothetical protein RL322_953 [Pseudomonadota bacterium]|jgi:lipopolysaccharide transport system ATP-binding protein
METLLQVDQLGKKYARSMRHSLDYGLRDVWSEMSGRSRDPTLRHSEFWALREVSFSLCRGECLAVLGGNGAGKSTLLKLLSGMLLPDGGRIVRRGRMEKLIELAGGFSPQLTGRENVALRACMLGLSARQISERMDEMAAFAEVGDFLDSPVQFYSSGMRSRLGFALSVVMRPDILLIDEVLAVGDLGFRMKCYERVDAMRRDAAVVLVTHGMNHVARMATRVLVLNKGRVDYLGDVQGGIARYHELAGAGERARDSVHQPDLIDYTLLTPQGPLAEGSSIEFGSPLLLQGRHFAREAVTLSIILGERMGPSLIDWNSRRSDTFIRPGDTLQVELGPLELCPGWYQLSIVGFASDGRQLFLSRAHAFRVNGDYFNSIRMQPRGQWRVQPAPLPNESRTPPDVT